MSGFDIDHQLKKEGFGQFYSTTCWYASYRMLCAWKRVDFASRTARLKEAGLDLQAIKHRGLLPEEFPRAAWAFQTCGWRGSWVDDQSAGMICHLLKSYGPLWIASNWRGNERAGHAVVIVGYRSQMEQFVVYNPYNRFEPGTVDVEYLEIDAIRNWIKPDRYALQAMA